VKKRSLLIIAVTLLVLLVLGVLMLNAWAPSIAEFLIVNEPPRRSDMIIIPSGTDNGGRIRYGVTLYKKGFAPKILLSGSSHLWKETGIDLMKVYTTLLGVPEGDILVDHDSGSTVENAIFAKEIAKKNGCRSVLVVTSPTHSRRTKKVFQKYFPKMIGVTVTCDLSTFHVKRWWKKPAMAREVSYEYFVFLWYGLFGY
jgi:uncharacterized SAM-binding protein YcdF (DUF218 family)